MAEGKRGISQESMCILYFPQFTTFFLFFFFLFLQPDGATQAKRKLEIVPENYIFYFRAADPPEGFRRLFLLLSDAFR